MSVVKQMKLEIFTLVEQEANHNGPIFLNRFNESLHYYSIYLPLFILHPTRSEYTSNGRCLIMRYTIRFGFKKGIV